MIRTLRLLLFILVVAAVARQGVMMPLAVSQLQRTRAERGGIAQAATERAYLESFAPARDVLRTLGGSEPVIGYLTGGPIDFEHTNPYSEPYMLAQYALAPTVIDSTPAHRIVLVNFLPNEAERLDAVLKQPGVRVLVTLGPGRALVETEAR